MKELLIHVLRLAGFGRIGRGARGRPGSQRRGLLADAHADALVDACPAGDTGLRAPALDAPSPSFGKTFVTDLVAQMVEIRTSTRRSRVRPRNLDVLRAVCCEPVHAYLANMSWKLPRCCLPDFSAISVPRVTSSDTLAVFPSGRMPCQRVI